jgi:serine protease AprX
MLRRLAVKLFRILILLLVALSLSAWNTPAQQPSQRVIVMGQSADHVAGVVQHSQGTVERYLRIINGVVAQVDQRQIAYLRSQGLTVAPNTQLSAAATSSANGIADASDGVYPTAALGINRSRPHNLSGRGVTVALVDSGIPAIAELRPDRTLDDGSLSTRAQDGRFIIYHDFISTARSSQDPYGHGTHLAGTIADATPIESSKSEKSRGIAPNANLVIARAIGPDGVGTYADVISAIDWVVGISDRYDVRVLNLSLTAPVQSLYWVDPLNQAVMRAWQSGLVVVVAAGNNGPGAESVAVPGNNPYVITVGAYRSAAIAPSAHDELTSFSARGPTPDAGFAKPDILAPGVRIISGLPNSSALADSVSEGQVVLRTTLELADTQSEVGLYQLSGTSMAAAEVSGLVALLLERQPNLTNDQVKWLLARTTHLAVDKQTGNAAYSTWEQGFGKVDASALLRYNQGAEVGSANLRMDIARDLDTSAHGRHYVGMTAYDPATGQYSIPASGDSTGTYFNWCGQFVPWPGSSALGNCGASGGGTTAPSGGSVWSGGGSVWSGHGSVWSGGGSVWSGGGSVWSGSGSVWSGGGSVWSGSGSVWSGGGSVWSGGGSVWSGSGTVWSGITASWMGGNG